MNAEFKDWVGNVLQPEDLVIYAGNYPIGRQPYIGKISHLTGSHRLAIRVLKSTWHSKTPNSYNGYSTIDKEVLKNLEFYDKASVYREAITVIKYEQKTNISN